MISLTFPGRPVPWARVKRGRGGKAYTPAKQLKHRRDLAMMLKASAGDTKLTGPVCLRVRFDYARNETVIEITPGIKGMHRDKRADVDNCAKAVMEAIELSGIVEDDAQIAYLEAEKIG